jgi:hypothetical protein
MHPFNGVALSQNSSVPSEARLEEWAPLMRQACFRRRFGCAHPAGTDRLRDADAGGYLNWGSCSGDLVDLAVGA